MEEPLREVDRAHRWLSAASLPYEDEIRSVEGPDALRGGPEGTAPTSAPESSLSPHPPGGR